MSWVSILKIPEKKVGKETEKSYKEYKVIMKVKKLMWTVLLAVWMIPGRATEPVAPGTVRGKVIDAKTKEPMDFVNVAVRKSGETVPLTGVVTDETGTFTFTKLGYGTYTVNLSFVGYRNVEKSFTLSKEKPSVNLRTIPLEEDTETLGEVKVLGQRSQMKFEIDKRVFNVDQNISSTGGSASDVLTNIPSVEVDNEGEVSLRGSTSVTIWINGRASGLTADNRAQILEQMPAESIERIEVITNPSAKYSPEGTAGIINIILKQDRKAGYYGSVQGGVDTRGGWNASGNINYSSGKIEAYANVGYRKRKSEGGGYSNRTNTDEAGNAVSYLNQKSDNDGHGGPVFIRTGLTYHLTKQDHLNIGAFGMFGDRKQNTRMYYESNVPGSFLSSRRLTDSDNSMKGGNIDFGYKHDFSEKSNLDIVASWNTWNMDGTNIYNQYSLFGEGRETSSYQRQKNDVRSHDWEIQADYVNEFSKNSKLEAGYKGSFSRQKSPVETYAGETEEAAVPDEQLYNNFLYDQDIHAAYVTYSGRMGNFGFQGGLRGEYSRIDTKSLGYGQTEGDVSPHQEDYFSLFPSVFLSYALPSGNEIQLNYTRRISRPWGRQLNPFMNVTDSTNISFGNPYLSPQYSNAFELNYIKNWDAHMVSLSAYYRNTDDVIQRISYLKEDILMSTYENVAKTQSAGAELVIKNNFGRRLDLTTTVNLFYSKLDGFSYLPEGATQPVTGESNEDFSWNARMIANLLLPASFSLQVTGNYNARQLIAQGYRKANYSLDAGIRKSFLDRKLSLSVNARDILNSRKWKTETSGQGFVQYASNWRMGRTVGFTLTYSFGNMKASRTKNQRAQEDNSLMNQMDDNF